QKTGDAIEDVPTCKEATKNLIVQGVQPLAANLNGVVTVNDREIVLRVRAPEQFVNRWIQEERVSKAKRRRESHGCVSRHIWGSGIARSQLTRVREVSFVQLRCGNGAEQIEVKVVDL